VVDAAFQLEQMGAHNHLDGVEAAYATLLAGMQDLQVELTDLIINRH
jgi:hypothetical protein